KSLETGKKVLIYKLAFEKGSIHVSNFGASADADNKNFQLLVDAGVNTLFFGDSDKDDIIDIKLVSMAGIGLGGGLTLQAGACNNVDQDVSVDPGSVAFKVAVISVKLGKETGLSMPFGEVLIDFVNVMD
ncbi:18161_t:CDS:2, partial [Acaulospora morrowiae]